MKLSRFEFLCVQLCMVIAGILIASLDIGAGALVFVGFALAVHLLAASRRLADMCRSQWLILLLFVPYVNIVFFIWLLLCPSKEQST